MRKIIWNLFMLMVFVSCFHLFPGQAAATPSIPCVFEDEGSFVEGISVIGGLIIGIPIAVVGAVPAGVVGFIAGISFKDPVKGAAMGVVVLTIGACAAGQFIVGLPFLILKKIFYDGPKALKDNLRKNFLKAPSAYGHESRK